MSAPTETHPLYQPASAEKEFADGFNVIDCCIFCHPVIPTSFTDLLPIPGMSTKIKKMIVGWSGAVISCPGYCGCCFLVDHFFVKKDQAPVEDVASKVEEGAAKSEAKPEAKEESS